MAVVLSEACSAVQVEDRTVEHHRKQTNDSSLTAWDGAFESSLSESITHWLRLQKYSGIQWSGKNARFTACRECVVFLRGTVGYKHGSVPRYFKAFATNPSILSLLLACLGRCRERTATGVLARRKACCNMLTWRDGLAKTFELQTCARPNESFATARCPPAVRK